MPVWPIWKACGFQPESTAAREAPTAAPSESAKPSTSLEVAAGATTAGDHDRGLGELGATGRPCGAAEATILAFFAESEIVAANSSFAAAPSDSSGAAELGLTVMIGVPLVTFACTV